MIIGSTVHTYSINQSIQSIQLPADPAKKPVTTDNNHRKQDTQSKSNSSNLDSLGQGNLL